MNIADQIAALDAPERKRVDMTEFWGEGSIIFATPLTARDITRITRRHKDFQSNPSIEAMVDLLIWKAEDENGDKVFTVEHRPMLIRRPLPEITAAIAVIEGVDTEDVEKN